MHREILYYGSFLVFPFLIATVAAWYKLRPSMPILVWDLACGLLAALSVLFIYARFIEPSQLTIQTTKINTGFSAKVAVLADLHLGAFKDKDYLKRVVQATNQLEVDFVIIPGDLTYYPKQDLNDLFSPLAEIKVPAFAVLGNHDSEQPGPPLQKELQAALEKHGVRFLYNQTTVVPNMDIRIVGLGDHWADEDDVQIVDQYAADPRVIIIAHNPDSVYKYFRPVKGFTISGHTHGGQVRIPFIYKRMIPTKFDFDQGLYQLPNGNVFVSSGLGEVSLPLRLGIPPVIDVLEFY